MLALVVVLLVTNAVTIGALVYALRVRLGRESPPEPALANALPPAKGAAGAPPRSRRVISIEIHNPLELAGQRNRMFGIAGSFVPDLTRRVVYDQTARLLRDGLAEHRVVADVRVHVFAAAPVQGGPQPIAPDVRPAVVDLSPLAAEFAEEDEPDRLAE
jgi:hypothetical protein